MANLKAIRDRIQSVKILRKLQKPCAWWRLLGASCPTTSNCHASLCRPLGKVLYTVQTRLRFEAVRPPLLKKRELRSVGLLVVSGDRGLCGSYNTNIIRRAESRARTKGRVGLKYVLVGRKANNTSNAAPSLLMQVTRA